MNRPICAELGCWNDALVEIKGRPVCADHLGEDAETQLERLRPRLALVHLQPGDTLVLRHPGHLSEDTFERLQAQVRDFFPGRGVLVLDDGVELGGVVRPVNALTEDKA